MAVADSHAEHNVVFAWSQESVRDTITKTEWIDRYEGYELRTYPDEDKMLTGFLEHLNECDPDMLITLVVGLICPSCTSVWVPCVMTCLLSVFSFHPRKTGQATRLLLNP